MTSKDGMRKLGAKCTCCHPPHFKCHLTKNHNQKDVNILTKRAVLFANLHFTTFLLLLMVNANVNVVCFQLRTSSSSSSMTYNTTFVTNFDLDNKTTFTTRPFVFQSSMPGLPTFISTSEEKTSLVASNISLMLNPLDKLSTDTTQPFVTMPATRSSILLRDRDLNYHTSSSGKYDKNVLTRNDKSGITATKRITYGVIYDFLHVVNLFHFC